MKKMIRKIVEMLIWLDCATDIVPLLLEGTVLDYNEDECFDSDEEDCGPNIHFGLVGMALTVLLFVGARIALSAVILFLA